MAVAKQLGDLLGLVVSSAGEGTLYLCATCVLLERLSRERDGEAASEELLAGLLEKLHLELDNRAKRRPTCDGGESERGGRGEGEGSEWWEKGAGERWESVWQLSRETARVVGEEQRQTLLSFVCECHRFQAVSCQLLATALAAGRCCGFWRESLERRFLLRFVQLFWSTQIDRFSERVDPFSDGAQETIWCSCLEHLVLFLTIHKVFHENQYAIAQQAHIEEFLCKGTSNNLAVKLAHVFPQALYVVYQTWWSSDKDALLNSHEIPTRNKVRTGLILKVGKYQYQNLCVHCSKSLKSQNEIF